jgi:hypothetical protein
VDHNDPDGGSDMTKSRIIALFTLLALSGGVALAGDVCWDLEQEIVGKTFVAKEPLYDTKVGLDGIIKLERDAEEVRKGDKFDVAKVKCGSSKIKLVLRPDRYGGDVEIYFVYSKVRRTEEGAMENLKKMMGYVFEEASEEEGE